MRYKGIWFKNTAGPVISKVEAAAKDMGASEMELRHLLNALSIESGGSPKMTFMNPDLRHYKDKPGKRPKTGFQYNGKPCKRPGDKKYKGAACWMYRGPFQILVRSPIERYYQSKGPIKYDIRKFGDPYHQAQVILQDMRTRKFKKAEKITKNKSDQPALVYLIHQQGSAGAGDLYRLAHDPKWKNIPLRQIPASKFVNTRTGTSYPHQNFTLDAYKSKKYGITSLDQLTAAMFWDFWKNKSLKNLGLKGKASSQDFKVAAKPDIFLLGDSNTVPHKKFWKAWAAKQFGLGTKVVDETRNGDSTWKVLEKLEKPAVDKARGVIIGSTGGVNVTAEQMGDWGAGAIEKKLAPDGPHYRKRIAPLMARLKTLQDKGVKIIFYGLPFGRGEEEKGKCKNNTPVARQKMDELLAFGARQYGIPYNSVFEETRAVKGKGCGVHYKNNQYKAYKDALRSKNPDTAPIAEEEEKYAQSIVSGKKIKIKSVGSTGRFLAPYKYIQAAGITFNKLYQQFEEVYGSNWDKALLPNHGKDRIFGPEHFVALEAMAKKTNDEKMMAMLTKRSSFRDPVIAKAEKKAEDSIEDVEADNISQVPGADDPIAEPTPRMTDLLGTEKPKTVAKKEPAKPKPITIEQAILVSKQGDTLDLKVKKEVTHKIDLGITTKDITIFKKGKSYKGKVLAGNKITFKREPIFTRGDSETMTKTEFIKTMKEHGGDPCNILDCQLSTITRAGTKKTFAEFLKDPSFGTQLAENKTKRKIRIILNC